MVSLAPAHVAAQPTASTSSPIDIRLELTWQSEAPRVWAAKVKLNPSGSDASPGVSPGVVSDLVNLTPGRLLSAGFSLNRDGTELTFGPPLSIQPWSIHEAKSWGRASRTGAIGLRIRGSRDSQVGVQFFTDVSEGHADSPAMTVSLEQLSSGNPVENVIGDGCRWTLKRVSGDRFRVGLFSAEGKPACLFWDDEHPKIGVSGDPIGIHDGRPLELVCDTYAVDQPTVPLMTQAWPVDCVDGEVKILPAHYKLPPTEGGFRLRWSIRTTLPSGGSGLVTLGRSAIGHTLAAPMQLIRGATEDPSLAECESFIVVTARATTSSPALGPDRAEDSYRLVSRIEPMGSLWSVSRLMPRTPSQWFAHQPSPLASPSRSHHDGKAIATLPPGGRMIHPLPISARDQPHRLVIRFPSPMAMRVRVSVVAANARGEVEDEEITGTILRNRLGTGEDRWGNACLEFWPKPNSTHVLLVNEDPEQTAGIESIELFQRDLNPNPVDSINRGVLASITPRVSTQRVNSSKAALARRAWLQVEWQDWLHLLAPRSGRHGSEPLRPVDASLAVSRLIQSVEQSGLDGVMLTVHSDGRSLYRTDSLSPDASWYGGDAGGWGDHDLLELVLRRFERAGLQVIPCVRPNAPLIALERAIRSDADMRRSLLAGSPLNGADVELNNVRDLLEQASLYDPLHPMVMREVIALVSELRERCSSHGCVPAIGLIADGGTPLRLAPSPSPIDPAMLSRFALTLDKSSPPPANIEAWVQRDGKASYDRWRADELSKVYHGAADSLAIAGLNLMVFSTGGTPWELAGLDRYPRITRIHSNRLSPLAPLATRAREESKIALNKSIAATSQPPTPPVGAALTLADRATDGPIRIALIDRVTARRSMAKLLAREDRTVLAMDLQALLALTNSETRRWIDQYRAIPAIEMVDVAPADEAMKLARVRLGRHDGETYVYAINQSRWPLEVQMALSQNAPWQRLNQPEAKPEEPLAVKARQPILRQRLEVGEMQAIRIASADVEVRSWAAQVAGDEVLGGAAQDSGVLVAAIAEQIRRTADTLTTLTEPHPYANWDIGTFDSDGDSEITRTEPATAPSGWLVAQYPPGCVSLESKDAFEGNRCVRLCGDRSGPGGTWMVSRVIDPPPTGRLAVGVRLRGAAADASSTPPVQVRIALEGNVAGVAVRQVKVVAVPRDGQWSSEPHKIELPDLPNQSVEMLRLTVDLMSSGTVWLDDVVIYDWFMTETEKSQLQSQIFLALSGIGRGDLSPAAKLLDSHWVQHLHGVAPAAIRPIMTNQAINGEAPQREAAPGPTVGRVPGVAERIRGWLPKQLW